MKLPVIFRALGVAAICLWGSACVTAERPTLALRDVTVVDGMDGSLHPNRTVLVTGDRIAAIGLTGEPEVRTPEQLRRRGQIARLLAGWRGAGWPVVHVQHLSTSPDSPLRPDSPGVEIKPEATPRDGEPLFQKRVNRLFIGTDLEPYLRRRRIANLGVVGLTTEH